MPRHSSHNSVRRRGGGNRSRKLLARARGGAKKSRGGARLTLTVTGGASITLEAGKTYTLSTDISEVLTPSFHPKQKERVSSRATVTKVVVFTNIVDDGMYSKRIEMTINGQPVQAYLNYEAGGRGSIGYSKPYSLSIITAQYRSLAETITQNFQYDLRKLFDNTESLPYTIHIES